LSGVKEILIRIDRGSNNPVDNFDGLNWDFTIDLEDGRHFAFVRAIDNVGNSKRDIVFFTVFS